MKKLTFIILSLFLINCNYKSIDKSGLKGKVKKCTEYKININDESEKDTFSITTNIYNRNGLLVNQLMELKNGKSFKQDFIYNNNEKLIKEINYFDKNKIIVNYEYKDTLLIGAYSNFKSDTIATIMNEKYHYSNNNKLDRVYYSQIIISDDDTTTFVKKSYYDKNEKLNKLVSQWNSKYDSTFNKTKFEYNKFGLFSKSSDFNKSDSLIGTDEFKYVYDDNGSWVQKEIFRNDTLKYIYTRKIEYK